MSGPGAVSKQSMRALAERLSPQQRQYALLGLLLLGGIGLLWLVLVLADDTPDGDAAARAAGPDDHTVTNLDVMPPGSQLDPVDEWIGTAGRRLADFEQERERQNRLNQERQAFEARTAERFAELERRLLSEQRVPEPPVSEAPDPMPPEAQLPLPPASMPSGAMPLGTPPAPEPPSPPSLQRVTLTPVSARESAPTDAGIGDAPSTSTFLPVSFTRGVLLGGLDAPTGGQAQSNPHPVLIRLSDDSVLPNGFRGHYRECFVIAAGFGDISAERAYLRTESLSCVRTDGGTLEVSIQGSVYGEDGKVGMRGRLVTKQGQMLANALLAGVVGGIGQGLATASADYSTSAFGTVSSLSGADAYRAGLGAGVGRALDRLAQYYIRLAEGTFPVIEIDAGREIDVVITRGVRLDVPMHASADRRSTAFPERRYWEAPGDDSY